MQVSFGMLNAVDSLPSDLQPALLPAPCATSAHDGEGDCHDDKPGEYGAGGGGSGASDCGTQVRGS